MRNTWLIIRREYLERVRAKSFIVSTILLPAFMFAVTVLPAKLAGMKNQGTRHIAVVASDQHIAEAVAEQLQSPDANSKFKVDVITAENSRRDDLNEQISSGAIDAYLWLTNDAIADGKVTYTARSTSDFIEGQSLRSAVNAGVTRARLNEKGISAAESEQLLKPVKMETTKLEGGKESKSGGEGQFFASFMVAMMLYFTLIVYGMAVMRSVLEEKTSRVMEVMLSSVKAKELMAGKVLGVGAVGLTQMAIWGVLLFVLGSGGVMASPEMRELFHFSPAVIAGLPVFFVLGYLLYSGLYAALGATVNSEQEAQQWQFFVTMPLIIPIVLLTLVIRQPDAPISVGLSMFPFFAPILMYVRMVAHTPPMWQIGLSIAILLVTMYAILIISSRIYRVGILMYGKRPTLPEIWKWLRYA